MLRFQGVLEECKLRDLEHIGPVLMWNNGRENDANIREWLNSFLSNDL